ncbi:MAG: hypothetical protein P1U85_07685 [Verrucomicrobiales bacterium]|jgi:hypothetical protein|nr:hypothetical protein [Verrucomicrobiales bacterium]
MAELISIDENVWVQKHSLRLIGMEMGRNVTILRLESGHLILHSTAAFSEEDRKAIESLGEPAWLLDATNFHDTLVSEGRSVFPLLPYFAPEGFPGASNSLLFTDPPEEWDGEVDLIKIEGMPKINEHVVFHRASGTLVVADLLFNQPEEVTGWTRTGLRMISGIREHPGCSRMYRFMIRDRGAFEASLHQILELPFRRIVVGHGDPIEMDARTKMRSIFLDLGYAV